MDDIEQKAIQQEIKHFQEQRHRDRKEIQQLTKTTIEQSEHIRFLEDIINNVIADLKGGIQ